MTIEQDKVKQKIVMPANNKPAHTGALLSVQDLRVHFELRKFGFSHAGYVKAVDGVSFELKSRLLDRDRRGKRLRQDQSDENHPGAV